MLIGVYGTAKGDFIEDVKERSFKVGKAIIERGHTLVTGACPGYPYDAVRGAASVNGSVIGYSPAISLEEHVDRFDFPTEGITDLRFVPSNYELVDNFGARFGYRNVTSTSAVDAAVIVGGGLGTLHELSFLLKRGRTVGVLTGSGGIVNGVVNEMIQLVSNQLFYERDPGSLVEKLTE